MIAKVKVVVLNKNGSIAWVEPKTNLSQALYYYEDYKDKDLGLYQTIQKACHQPSKYFRGSFEVFFLTFN